MKRVPLVAVAALALACDVPPAPPGPRGPNDEPPLVLEPIRPIALPPPIECEGGPVAVLAPVDGQAHPFETVRIDASQSRASNSDVAGSFVGEFEYTLRQRPEGSSATVVPNDAPGAALELDLPGRYVVQLYVYEIRDEERVRSCAPAELTIDAAVDGDLVAMLTWDHPSADLDLHTLREGGEPFNRDDDVFYGNKDPVGAPWSDDVDENPTLNVDDSEGYGPEMTTVRTPVVGDAWTFAVHYWNQQTDGDARTNARLRVFARNELVFDETVNFPEEQVFWSALEVRWTDDVPEVTVIDSLEDFPRPF